MRLNHAPIKNLDELRQRSVGVFLLFLFVCTAFLIGLQLVSGSPTSGFVTTIKFSVFSLVVLLCIAGAFRFYVFSADSVFERSASMALIIAYAGLESVSVEGNLLPALWMPFVCIFCYTLHPKPTARLLAVLILICISLPWTHPTALDKALWARYLVATILTIAYMEFAIAIFSSMQRENQTLGQSRQLFLESISHELKTPLNGAMGAFEAIKAGSMDPKDVEMYASIGQLSCKKASDLVDDLLAYQKLSYESGALDRKSVPINDLVLKLTDEYKNRAANQSLSFSLTSDIDAGQVRLISEIGLEKILRNLLDNALRYTKTGGIVVSIVSESETTLQISISDSGQGIAPDQLRQIFEPLYRVDTTVSGTGLGLAIVKRWTEAMKGTINVKSTVGLGSTFTLTVPAPITQREETLEPDQAIELDNQRGRVLLVDDSATNRLMFQAFLKETNFELTTAVNGNEGLKTGLSEEFDVIFMDINMPDMNGDEVARRLISKGVETPIVAYTAGVLPQDIEQIHESGFAATLLKPADKDAILKQISVLMPKVA
jgi:signal transduction histidine kinase/ActR/RegA family two-component response regulator